MTVANKGENRDSSYWHPAFRSAIKLEFEEYLDALDFQFETPLNTEPLKVDAIIIKKLKDVEIKKNLAAVFKTHNIVEFKSPGDFLSVNGFYKVYGYACGYTAITEKVGITDISITFIENRYPRKLIAHLREVRRFEVVERWPGIFHVKGDIVPIQIIETKRLDETESVWLSKLRGNLDASHAGTFAGVFLPRHAEPELRAYLYAVLKANPLILREVQKMSDTLTLEQVLIEEGWTAKWLAEGKAEGKLEGKAEVVRNALAKGLSIDLISEITGLDAGIVQQLPKTSGQ